VITTGENPDLALGHLVDLSVLAIDTARPTAGQLVLQRFRLAGSLERLALNFSNQPDDP